MLYDFKQHTNTFQILQNIYIHSTINCFWPFIYGSPLFNGTTWTRPCGGEPEVHLFYGETSRPEIYGCHVQVRGLRVPCSTLYACVNVCVCVYNPTSIGSLSLFSSSFKLFLGI